MKLLRKFLVATIAIPGMILFFSGLFAETRPEVAIEMGAGILLCAYAAILGIHWFGASAPESGGGE